MLSYEPMFAWSLDGPIEFRNVGSRKALRFCTERAIVRSSHALLQTKFPIEFAGLRLQLQVSVTGPAS